MKNLMLFAMIILFSSPLFGQDPGLNYQAVLRNGDQLIVNKTVKVKVTLLEESPEGNIVYQEMQNTTTDGLGYLNFMIGEGDLLGGKYSDLAGKSDLYIQLEVEIDNSGEMLDFGTTRMGVVHYALYGQDEDADPDNEIQTLSLNGEMLALSRSDSVSLSSIASPWKTVDTGQSYVLSFTPDNALREDEPKKKIKKMRNGGIKEEWEVDGDKICEERTKVTYDNLPERAQEGIDSMRSKSDKIPDMKDIEFACTSKKVNDKLVEKRYIGFKGAEKEEMFKILVIGGGKTVVFGYEKKGKEVLKGTSVKINDDWHQTVIEEKEVKEDGSVTPKQTSFQMGNNLLEHSSWIKPGTDGFTYSDQYATKKGGELMGVNIKVDPYGQRVHYSNLATNDTTLNFGFGIGLQQFSPNINLSSQIADIAIYGDSLSQVRAATKSKSILKPEFLSFKIKDNPIVSMGAFTLQDACVGALDFNFYAKNGNALRNNQVAMPTIGLGNLGNQPVGFIRVSGNGSALFEMTANTVGSPYFGAYTPGGSLTQLTTTTDQNSPYFLMTAPDKKVAAYMLVNSNGQGTVGAHSLVQIAQNPVSAEQLIVYPQLSGPESSIYDRGTATLINGEISVECPDHFQMLADPNSMTITLTPLSADSKGLAVIEKTTKGFKVKELYQGTGNYSFDYLVMCTRASQKDHQVYQSKAAFRPADEFAKKELGHHKGTVIGSR